MMNVPWTKQKSLCEMTMNNLAELEAYFYEHSLSTYDRQNYDRYLKDHHFSFAIPSIHITGTNGKGSTAKYLYEIYLSAGYHVGLYQSPYLNSVLEMVSVDGKVITEREYLELFNELHPDFEKYELTSFEMETIIALTYFQRKGINLVIIEVGMGGYIDATNIITPELSIITSVALEHTAYLGKSVSEIADNKAGIIKQYMPVLLGKLDENALFAIRQRAKQCESQIYIVDDYHNEVVGDHFITFDYRPYKSLELSTVSEYQLKNASIAVEATKLLQEKFPVNEEAVRQGLKTVTLPCRYEFIKENILLDGAHNAEAMSALANTLEKNEHRPIHVIFASFRDKNVDSMLISLGRISNDVVLTTFNHKRARREEEYFLYLGDYQFKEDYMSYLHELEEKYPDDLIIVTGSLCFTGIVREKLLNEAK